MKLKTYILIALTLTLITCKDDDPAIPTGTGNQVIIEQSLESLSYWDARFKGTISNLNKRTISQYGHCWDTQPNPDLSKSRSTYTDATTDRVYTSILEALQPNMTYYIRSYFILNTDTAYSTETNFKTLAIKKPVVIKSADAETDLYLAVLHGSITNTGGEITSKGFYFSATPNVSQTDSFIVNNTGNMQRWQQATELV